jgi:transposase
MKMKRKRKKNQKGKVISPKERVKKLDALEQINYDAAGVDIGDREIVAAVPVGRDEVGIRTFGTFTRDLCEISEWFKKCTIKTVAMESTGVYWINLYELLESKGFEVYLVDSRRTKNVSGRKSDVDDSEWIYQLHTYGLLPKCYRPPEDIRKIRDMVRHRDNLIKSRVNHINRMQKSLQCMNIKLTNVLSNIVGVTGLKIIRAIVSGERSAEVLSQHRDPHCKKSKEEIIKSLEGHFQEGYLFSLRQDLETYDYFTQKIKETDDFIEKMYHQIKSQVDPGKKPLGAPPRKKKKSPNSPDFDLRSHLYRIIGVDLTAIDGLNATAVQTIITHTGVTLDAWPTDKNFISWLSLCPNNDISGGKVISSWTKRSKNAAAQALRIGAMSVGNSKSALGAYFRRIKAREGVATAVTATAAKMGRIIYAMIKKKEEYRDIGEDYYEKKYKEKYLSNLKRRASWLGYTLVTKDEKVKTEECHQLRISK